MIEAIREIGKNVLVYGKEDGGNNAEIFIKSICQNLENIKSGKGKNKDKEYIQRVIIINFNLDTKKIEIDFEQINNFSSKKYVWVGNTIRHKLYCTATSDKINRLLSTSLYELTELISGTLKTELKKSLPDFFNIKNVRNMKNKESKKYFINYKKFALKSDNIVKYFDKLGIIENEDDYKKIEKKYYGELNKLILQKLNLKKEEISIYSISINNKLLAQDISYKELLLKEKVNELFSTEGSYKTNVTENGICSICNNKTSVTSNFSSFTLKFFINDKLGFSSNLDGLFTNNFNVCEECYKYLIVGENFIKNNLNTFIGLKTYIIPKFISKAETDITNFAKYLKNKTYYLTNLSNIKELEDFLEQFKRYEEGVQNYLINYLFYTKSKSEFKILKLIKDIPPTRLTYIRKIEEDISNLVDKKFDAKKDFKISLNKLWGNIPVKKNNSHGYSKFLGIVDGIFSNINVNYNFLINQFTEVIKIIKFKNENYNIYHKTDIVNKVIQQNFIILFFKKLGILGGINMSENMNITENEKLLLPKNILDYFTDLKIYIDRQKQALFLIGYLIGEIGSNQSQTSDTKKKPILNKINFQGMDYKKLMRLTNEIFEKLDQYKILSFNENIFSAAKRLLESNAQWQLSNQENVFYVLSGYAYSNYIGRKRSKDNYNEKLEKAEKRITEKNEQGKDTAEDKENLVKAKNIAKENKFSEASKILVKIIKGE